MIKSKKRTILSQSFSCCFFYVDKTSTWRLVPLESLNSQEHNMKYRVPDPTVQVQRNLEWKSTRSCDEYEGRLNPPSLYESEIAMSRIERFLAKRDHVDKSEFDFLVRSLVEVGRSSNAHDGPYPIARNHISVQSSQQHSPMQGSMSGLSKHRRRGRLEPAINSTHLPTVSVAEQSILRNQLIQKLQARQNHSSSSIPSSSRTVDSFLTIHEKEKQGKNSISISI